MNHPERNDTPDQLFSEIRSLIEASRASVVSTVNSAIVTLYWQIGKRIHNEVLSGERAEYGKQIVSALSRQLTVEYGRGFNRPALNRMCRFYELYPDINICATASHKLSWSHYVELITLKDDLQRRFYAEMCSLERWSVRVLRERIDSMLYERTALSKKPAETIKVELENMADKGEVSPNIVLKDPYVLDFLQLNDRYLEKDLEDAILRELEQFLLELGAGFTFIARQKRIEIDGEDFYIDLLFYNRKLKRLVAIDLKLGRFKADYKGQMELYLRWLEKYEQEENEASPLGLILCSDKKEKQIELLELDKSGIHVAEYMTVLPPKDVLQKKLHDAIQKSRLHIENCAVDGND